MQQQFSNTPRGHPPPRPRGPHPRQQVRKLNCVGIIDEVFLCFNAKKVFT